MWAQIRSDDRSIIHSMHSIVANPIFVTIVFTAILHYINLDLLQTCFNDSLKNII